MKPPVAIGVTTVVQAEEIRALGELAGEAVGSVATRVQEMHAAIAQRAFDAVGEPGTPVRIIHDGIARGVYAAVRGALKLSARAGAEALSRSQAPDARSLEETTAGRIAIGALNGAFGDRLSEGGNPLAVEMNVRQAGRSVELNRGGLARAFPAATPRLAVFTHGLCETEDAWWLGAGLHRPYGVRLQVELGYTPVYVRYNSGRHISDNGRDLARVLDELVSSWPVQVSEIALIGHSVGGLIARSACHQGAGQRWVSAVRHAFMLGCPHMGAPLERAAHSASAGFALLPETRTLANALNLRSAGLKDLRYGYLLEEDWCGSDPDAFVRRAAREVPFLRSANHYFVSASVSRNPDGLAGRMFGDMLVVGPSAWAHTGRGQRLMFPVDHYRHFGGLHHLRLLNHPAIYEQIRKWLSGRPALPPPSVVGDTSQSSVRSGTEAETCG